MNPLVIAAIVGRGILITYTMDDITNESTCADGDDCDYSLRFSTDGSIDSINDLNGDASHTPWSDDPDEDGTGWHVRLVSHDAGVDVFTDNLTVGTWYALTSTRSFVFVDSDTSGPYSRVSEYTFALSDDAGSTTYATLLLTLTLPNAGP